MALISQMKINLTDIITKASNVPRVEKYKVGESVVRISHIYGHSGRIYQWEELYKYYIVNAYQSLPVYEIKTGNRPGINYGPGDYAVDVNENYLLNKDDYALFLKNVELYTLMEVLKT